MGCREEEKPAAAPRVKRKACAQSRPGPVIRGPAVKAGKMTFCAMKALLAGKTALVDLEEAHTLIVRFAHKAPGPAFAPRV